MVGREVERELKCRLSQQLKLLRNGEFNHITIILTLPVNLYHLGIYGFNRLTIVLIGMYIIAAFTYLIRTFFYSEVFGIIVPSNM